MSYTTTIFVRLTEIICYKCGVPFGMPEYLQVKLRESGENFYCPNGHPQCYRESDKARFEKQLQQERQRHDQTQAALRDAERALSATKGQVTKLMNRAKNGVCPCCHRTFKNLQRHMATKHAEKK